MKQIRLGTNREIAAKCTEEPCGRAAYEGEDDSVTLDRWLRPDPCGTPEPHDCQARIRFAEAKQYGKEWGSAG